MTRDHLMNRVRNALFFSVRYPWVRRGRNVHVQWSTRMWSPNRHIVIGDDVGIGGNCIIQCDLDIGNKVLIAANVAFIGSDDHRFDEIGTPMWDAGRGGSRRTVVEDDVWIGYGAIVLSGSRIGKGAIVAAGAVIAGDVEPYSVMVGYKARCLRKRFSAEEIVRHEDLLRDRQR